LPGSRTTEPYNLPRLVTFPSLPLPCLPCLSFVFAATAGRERPSSPSPSVALSETKFTSNRTDLIDVTQDPDLHPAQACLVSWICRVYRPFASCLRPLLPDAIASSRHMHPLSCSVSPFLAMCVYVCPQLGPPPSVPIPASFSERPGHDHWSFTAPRPDQSSRIVSAAQGHAGRRSWAVGTNLVSGSSRPRVETPHISTHARRRVYACPWVCMYMHSSALSSGRAVTTSSKLIHPSPDGDDERYRSSGLAGILTPCPGAPALNWLSTTLDSKRMDLAGAGMLMSG